MTIFTKQSPVFLCLHKIPSPKLVHIYLLCFAWTKHQLAVIKPLLLFKNLQSEHQCSHMPTKFHSSRMTINSYALFTRDKPGFWQYLELKNYHNARPLILSQLVIKYYNHNSSQHPHVIGRYSTSELDLPTTACFLLFHETKFPPTNVRYPVVDLLSVLEPFQLASV